MIYDTTGYRWADSAIASASGGRRKFVSSVFAERQWRANEEDAMSVDLDKLKQYLADVAPCVPHLISCEYLRNAGRAESIRDILATFEQERPDILRMLYSPDLRFIPQWQSANGSIDRATAEMARRKADPIEVEIIARASVLAIDQYVFGVSPKQAKCRVCACANVDDLTAVDLEKTWEIVPQYLAGCAQVLAGYGRPLAATVLDEFVSGLGKFPAGIPMPLDFWTRYTQEAAKAYGSLVWWKPWKFDGKKWLPQPRAEVAPFAAALMIG